MHVVTSVILFTLKGEQRIDFVELCGSEQAVANESFVNGASVKDFITKSFNGLSSKIVKSTYSKLEGQSHRSSASHQQASELRLIKYLDATLNPQSKIVLISCVSPSP